MHTGGNLVHMYPDPYWKRLGWGGCKSFYLNVSWLFYFPVKWLKPDFFFKVFPHGQVCVSLEVKSRLMVLYFKSFHCDSFLAWDRIL